jgi:hypothetical protein
MVAAKKKPMWEGSKADDKADKAGAKKTGMSAAKYENSKADKKADAAGQKKLDAKGGKAKKGAKMPAWMDAMKKSK